MHASKETLDPSYARRGAGQAGDHRSRTLASEASRHDARAGAEAPSPWSDALAQLDRTAELLDLDPGLHQMLRRPRHVIEVAVPIRTDEGRMVTYDGFRVQHSLTLGPGKGGLRYHPRATLAEVKAWRCG